MLVPAGPDVPIATPTLPFVLAQPSAMCVAPSSWRTIRCSIARPCRALYSGRMAAPGQPKPGSTPSLSMTSPTACIAGILGMSHLRRDAARQLFDDLQQGRVVQGAVPHGAAGGDELGDQPGERECDAGLPGGGQRDPHVLVVQVDPEAGRELAVHHGLALEFEDPAARETAGEHVETGG